MKIRTKLVSIFMISTVTPMLIVAGVNYFVAKEELTQTRFDDLEATADLKARKLDDFFRDFISAIEFARNIHRIQQNLPILTHRPIDDADPEYKIARDILDEPLRLARSNYHLCDVLLLDPAGKVVYTTNPSQTFARLGKPLPYLDQDLLDSARDGVHHGRVFHHPGTGCSHFEIMLLALVSDLSSVFAGYMVFVINLDSIYSSFGDYSGLGRTGETLVGRAIIFINPLRHDPDAALKLKIRMGSREATPMQEAVRGKKGNGLSRDYRDIEVLAAWRYIPSVKWGMVAKIGADEALANITTLRDRTLISIVAMFALTGALLAVLLTRLVIRPLGELQRGAEIIGAGNLGYKVGTAARDEVGQLSRAFDLMSDNLKQVTASRDELDREMGERKKAEESLIRSEERYRSTLDNMMEGCQIIGRDWRYVYLNDSVARQAGGPRRNSWDGP